MTFRETRCISNETQEMLLSGGCVMTMSLLAMSSLFGLISLDNLSWPAIAPLAVLGAILAAMVLTEALGLRYIANNYVGIVEKLWSRVGSVPEGSIIALGGEAGYQADVLCGG